MSTKPQTVPEPNGVPKITKRRMAEQLGLQDQRLAPFDADAIRAIRAKYNISQAVLANILNVGVGAVRLWEQGLRNPTGSALKLLHLLNRDGLERFL